MTCSVRTKIPRRRLMKKVLDTFSFQLENVDLKDGLVRVVDVAIWGDSKRFVRLKESTKNGE